MQKLKFVHRLEHLVIVCKHHIYISYHGETSLKFQILSASAKLRAGDVRLYCSGAEETRFMWGVHKAWHCTLHIAQSLAQCTLHMAQSMALALAHGTLVNFTKAGTGLLHTLAQAKWLALVVQWYTGKLHPYFILVTFFTQPQFEAWKFYTWKCVNAREKLPHDKTA